MVHLSCRLGPCRSQRSGVHFAVMRRNPPPPVATLGQLQRNEPHWFWAHCEACRRSRALPLAPFVIRCGPDVSSDALRKNLRCVACGHRGACLQHPSYVDIQVGWQPFPKSQVP